MTLFDAYLVVDWSAKNSRSPEKESANAVWVGERVVAQDHTPFFKPESYFRTRHDCLAHLRDRLRKHRYAGRRVFLGFDFAYGYPAGFARALRLPGANPPWRLVWTELARLINDNADNTNNRFEVAGVLNSRCHGDPPGPFWGCHDGIQASGLRPYSPSYPYPVRTGGLLELKRETERRLRGVQSTWKLWGARAVGGQTLLGIPAVAKLRDDPEFADFSRVWPFETGFSLTSVPPATPFILHAEIWPGVVNGRLDPKLTIPDQAQVRAMVNWLSELDAADELLPLFGNPSGLTGDRLGTVLNEEGWIFGSGR
jgi:hypothetical protein